MSGSLDVPVTLGVNVTPQLGDNTQPQNQMVSPADMRNTYKPGMKKGGVVKKMAKGGAVSASSASRRGDGCAAKGKTKGKFV